MLFAPIVGCILAILPFIPQTRSHGRLIEPPSRASAWRYGFSSPANYNDHELYCGGFFRQWHTNKGKCGICGDAYDLESPRPHEFGGAYYTGVIVRRYPKNAIINIRIELTANHNGYFEFRVCDNYKNTTQECLDKHRLKLAYNRIRSNSNQDLYKFYPTDGNKIYEMKYRLPDISCNHCVLQWIYKAENNWGTCPNGTEMIGCGPQEQFRACADISINAGPQNLPPLTTTKYPTDENSPDYTTELPGPQAKYRWAPMLSIVFGALLVVLGIILFLYLYYYKAGERIKELFKFGKNNDNKIKFLGSMPPPPKEEAPLPPPRVRRAPNIPTMCNVNFHTESVA